MTPRQQVRIYAAFAAAATLSLVALVFSPVRSAGLVWDDRIFLHDGAWLRHGDAWIQFVLHGIPELGYYFRPLVVALFALEAHLFELDPAPMHMISLAMHLANTLLVGILGRRLALAVNGRIDGEFLPCVAMLFFGLHPVLIEPVVWISIQYDLLATFFVLSALWLNLAIGRIGVRAILVSVCFFFAACAKESAASLPLLLLIMDWLRRCDGTAGSPVQMRAMRLWPVYAGVLLAGTLYLAMRYWALGFFVTDQTPFSLSRLHLACFTYLAYWKMLLWPMADLAPIHVLPKGMFNHLGAVVAVCDFSAFAVLIAGSLLLAKRKPLGGLMVGVTAALLPVLNIVPIDFNESLYHERYLMMAIAVACVFLPTLLAGLGRGRLVLPVFTLGTVWLIVAVLNIRVTIPLWSDEVRLWQWAFRIYPDSVLVRDNLLSAYLDRGDLVRARPLADSLMSDSLDCGYCMLNVAHLSILQSEPQRAASALQRAKTAMGTKRAPKRMILTYLLATGNLDRLQGHLDKAESAYRAAISIEPLDASAHMNLAVTLVRKGDIDDARKELDDALSLYASDERTQRRKDFDRILAERDPGLHRAASDSTK